MSGDEDENRIRMIPIGPTRSTTRGEKRPPLDDKTRAQIARLGKFGTADEVLKETPMAPKVKEMCRAAFNGYGGWRYCEKEPHPESPNYHEGDGTKIVERPVKTSIELPCFGIKVFPDPKAVGKGRIISDLSARDGSKASAMFDAMELLILAHANAGIDITTPVYLEGIESCVEMIIDRTCDK